ncbi:alpha/beta fold hydrolase [Microbacterium horticulturae]|uniref:Alpha/beta fold hydrolase n=1 Tax=Microbacterium horticulturae TaxID=3028316 RepID=A0ABY8BX67_9MICO|nr:alpha/beta hydrolase [Microbacterium sp. KACC 23027]WEG07441.1 alpha/beta fold hydrolase [Microbacterium sp. KACC 23027]
MSRERHEIDVPVDGGMLHVGVWEADSADAPTALLIHGVTSSHLAWPFVADRLPGVRLIAPDLRGRGRSNRLAGPAGMAAHAADMVAVLDALSIDRAVVVGHSMGAFVSVVLADVHPDRVSSLVLVDGGFPLDVPADLDPDTAIRLVLGPTAERLEMRFTSTAEYLDFWRAHPAFRQAWTPELEDYLAYDLVEDDGGALHPATAYATVVDDTIDMNTGSAVPDALGRLRHPTRLLTVPRGLQDEEPGLYAPAHLNRLLADHPAVEHRRIGGFNHYTIVMSPEGADVVAPEIAAAISVAPMRSAS